MLPTHKERLIEKLKRQVERFEAKGYTDTAAHVALARLLNPPEAVSPRNTKKVKPEEKESQDGE